ncbi:MAG: hypothetical protein WC655_28790 [Candidatus Hydrogenedentales bacterium]
MVKRIIAVHGIALMAVCGAAYAQTPQHTTVYKEKGRFGGWPANHGIWIWDNEIVVGFSRGYYKDLGPERHNIDRICSRGAWTEAKHGPSKTPRHRDTSSHKARRCTGRNCRASASNPQPNAPEALTSRTTASR